MPTQLAELAELVQHRDRMMLEKHGPVQQFALEALLVRPVCLDSPVRALVGSIWLLCALLGALLA